MTPTQLQLPLDPAPHPRPWEPNRTDPEWWDNHGTQHTITNITDRTGRYL